MFELLRQLELHDVRLELGTQEVAKLQSAIEVGKLMTGLTAIEQQSPAWLLMS